MRTFRTIPACLLPALLALHLTGSLNAAESPGRTPFSKPAMLTNIAHSVIVPSYAEFVKRARTLAQALTDLKKSPETNTLAKAQEAWREAMHAWKTTYASHFGPAMENSQAHRIYYSPIRRASVDRMLRDSAPIDAAAIENLGVSVIGLGTLEYFLFDGKGRNDEVLKRFVGETEGRRRVFAEVLGADIVRRGEAILDAWKNESGLARKTFLTGGQDTVGALVNTLAFAVEAGVFARLRQMVGFFESNLTQPDYFEGGISGMSQRNMIAVLRGARAIYTGGDGPGLDDQVASVGSPIGPKLLAQFDATIRAFEAIGGPIENGLKNNRARIDAASEECKKLEVMIKVDLTSALGVTLTFTSVDGD